MKIAFIGKMFSGKTTSANYLVERHGFTRLAFADPVKDISVDILNLMEEAIHDSVFLRYGRTRWDRETLEERKGEVEVRKLLQLVGTELGRDLIGYEDVWVDMLKSRVSEMGNANIVIDDCRFENEYKALVGAGFTVVSVLRPEQDRMVLVKDKYPTNWEDVMNHPSETSLAPHITNALHTQKNLIFASNVVELLAKVDKLVEDDYSRGVGLVNE